MSGVKDMTIMFNKFRDAQAKICILEREVARLREALEDVKTKLLYNDEKVGPLIDDALYPGNNFGLSAPCKIPVNPNKEYGMPCKHHNCRSVIINREG